MKPTSFEVTVKYVDGEPVLEFTPEQMNTLDLKCGDTIEWNIADDGTVSFSRKKEELEYCVCGEKLTECAEAYIHLSKGY